VLDRLHDHDRVVHDETDRQDQREERQRVDREDSEEFYCPALVWDWDDGGRSVHEADCPPFASGNTMDRRFIAEHAYRAAGVYNVKVTLKRVHRSVAAATTTVYVRSVLGDPGESE